MIEAVIRRRKGARVEGVQPRGEGFYGREPTRIRRGRQLRQAGERFQIPLGACRERILGALERLPVGDDLRPCPGSVLETISSPSRVRRRRRTGQPQP
ncbi:MAG: hypothetical protein M3541_10450 [Acidobacteriota bacterium]|nr:hypothetical protein [Acidobacteriota bacterium]